MFMKNPSQSGFLIEVNGIREFNLTKKGGLIWYTMVPKQKKALGAGVYCHKTREKLSFSLGKYTTVFQAEVYAMKACAAENIDKKYKNRNIYTLSGSQAAIKALDKYQITSKLVWDSHQSLIQLARHNRVQLILVPGHEGIAGNETAAIWQEQGLHMCSPELNQPVASHLELPKERSRTG
jgi:ribonuclease HI